MGTQKDKKDKKDKKELNKNAKLQLKGRIFMTNVTEVVSLGKQGNAFCVLSLLIVAYNDAGSYTIQIFLERRSGG